MNNLLTTPIGLDAEIQKIQTSLYSSITARWAGTIDGYGKTYKNEQKEGGIRLEWWNTSEDDYNDVYFDDSSADATFFFIEGDSDSSEDELVYVSDVKCVFMVDLSKIISDVGRQDAQAQRDAVEMLRSVSKKFTVTGIEKGIETVFYGIETEKIKFNDMQPLHCFAVLMQLNYYLTDKCI